MPGFYRVVHLREVADLSIVIPAYNECKRIRPTLETVLAWSSDQPFSVETLVVDDGSSDSTADVVSEFPWVRLVRYGVNRGKGHAVREGVLTARGRRILFMDADLATPMDELAKLWAELDQGCSVAIGSRPLRESRLEVRQPRLREWAGRCFNAVVRLLAVPGIRDTQCGFKLFDRDVARWIFGQCVIEGFGFDVEVLHIALRSGIRVCEVPVRWAHQEGAAAFGSPASYVRHGLRMLADIRVIRRRHRRLRPGAFPGKASLG